MSYIRRVDRGQQQLLPPSVEEYVPANAPVRLVDAFADKLDLASPGFDRAEPAATGRPPCDPRDLVRLYPDGYLERVRSSRRLEAEAARNLEVIWLLRRVRPDFETMADFRKDNRSCFKRVFREFNLLCRTLELFGAELVAIDGAKFKGSTVPSVTAAPSRWPNWSDPLTNAAGNTRAGWTPRTPRWQTRPPHRRDQGCAIDASITRRTSPPKQSSPVSPRSHEGARRFSRSLSRSWLHGNTSWMVRAPRSFFGKRTREC